MWKSKKLYELCDIQSGLWTGKNEPFTKALVLRNTNFTASGKFDYSNVVELEVETKQLVKREVIKNDIILEKSGGGEKTPVGRVCIHDAEANIPYSLSNFTARLRVIDGQELDAQFLHRFLYFLYISGKTEPMQRHSTGIRNLQLAQYKDIDVPLPPLAEQQRIVAKLDAAFAGIDRAIEIACSKETELSSFKSSALDNIFQNLSNETKMGQVFEFVRGPFGGSLKKNMFTEEGFAVYEQQHAIRNQCSDFRYYVPREKYDEMSRFRVRPNAILMSCSGTIGKTTIVPESFVEGIINQALLMLNPNSNVLSKFATFYMQSSHFSQQLLERVEGAAQKNVASVKVLKEILIPLPSVEEQNSLVASIENLLSEISHTQETAKTIKTNYTQLKSAILAQELQPPQSEAA